jgi:hypothetical protein
VATTTSAPLRRLIICGLIETPPNTVPTLMDCVKGRAMSRSTSLTCVASSRVGTSTSTWVTRFLGASSRDAAVVMSNCKTGST